MNKDEIVTYIKSGKLSEDDSMHIYHALRDQHGWAGTFFTREDVEDAYGRPLTDGEWAAVQRTWEWRKGIQAALCEYGWEIIMDAAQEGVDTVKKIYAALERSGYQRALSSPDGDKS